MSKLEDFLGLTSLKDVKETVKVTVFGKELEFVIRPLSEAEHSEFQKRANSINKNKYSFDIGKYNDLILQSCIVEPNLSNEEFLKKAKCNDAVEFLHDRFPAGTLTDLAGKIQSLSGFETFEMEVENAKN